MNVRMLLTGLETVLMSQVKDNFPTDWDEDFITRSILKELRKKLKSVRIHGLKNRMKIEWSAFKLQGIPERKFGDIALLVNIKYHDGDRIEGVAFLEAKKRSRNKTKFGAMKVKQLRKIFRNSPRSMALLYDYDDITQFANIGLDSSIYNWYEWKPCTCSVVVPINTILSLKKKDITLYKFSLPFSYQLFFRYFHGFDLEFQKKPINIAKGYAEEIGLPRYLAVVSIAFGRSEPYRDIGFNRNRFERFE